MADHSTEIEIPERLDNEEPATSEQLQFIRQLVSGQSLQGYRFDYRKLGKWQASAVIDQLIAIRDASHIQTTPSPARKQGPGCIASLAKSTTALIFWAVILAGVAGGAYLIYNHIQSNPKVTASTEENAPPDQQASSNTPKPPNNSSRTTTGSSIFEGLGVSDTPSPTPEPIPTPPDSPSTNPTPEPEPATPPAPTVARDLAQQLEGLEKMLVSLSQYTRNDFTPDLRAASAQGMTKKLDAFPKALCTLASIDPELPDRIRKTIETFASSEFDALALRNEIKAIRAAFPDAE